MTTPKNRQLRGHFTGGQQDIEDFRYMLMQSVDESEWDLTFDRISSFGTFGPLRKWTFGFTSKT